MDTPGTGRKVEGSYLEKAISYGAYKQQVEELLAAGKATGPDQSEAMLHYSQLNQQRMHRVEKTMQLLPDVKELMLRVNKRQI